MDRLTASITHHLNNYITMETLDGDIQRLKDLNASINATKPARKLANENGIRLPALIPGSGQGKKVLKSDVKEFMEEREEPEKESAQESEATRSMAEEAEADGSPGQRFNLEDHRTADELQRAEEAREAARNADVSDLTLFQWDSRVKALTAQYEQMAERKDGEVDEELEELLEEQLEAEEALEQKLENYGRWFDYLEDRLQKFRMFAEQHRERIESLMRPADRYEKRAEETEEMIEKSERALHRWMIQNSHDEVQAGPYKFTLSAPKGTDPIRVDEKSVPEDLKKHRIKLTWIPADLSDGEKQVLHMALTELEDVFGELSPSTSVLKSRVMEAKEAGDERVQDTVWREERDPDLERD